MGEAPFGLGSNRHLVSKRRCSTGNIQGCRRNGECRRQACWDSRRRRPRRNRGSGGCGNGRGIHSAIQWSSRCRDLRSRGRERASAVGRNGRGKSKRPHPDSRGKKDGACACFHSKGSRTSRRLEQVRIAGSPHVFRSGPHGVLPAGSRSSAGCQLRGSAKRSAERDCRRFEGISKCSAVPSHVGRSGWTRVDRHGRRKLFFTGAREFITKFRSSAKI